jgi:hypothetical protein
MSIVPGYPGYFIEPESVPETFLYYNSIANKMNGISGTVYEFKAQYSRKGKKSKFTRIIEIICL